MAQAQEVFLFQPTSVTGCSLWLDAADSSVGSTVSGWINSEYQIIKSTSLNTTAGVWYLGRRQQAATGSADSYYLEIIHYNSALTTSQRQQVEGYLAWKWGLQGNLPANHPFKRFPPSP
jgi:hypothetical protein